MLGLRNKSAPKGRQFVVVQTVMTADGPDLYVTLPTDRDAALQVFTGVIGSAPRGTYKPQSTNRIRVMDLNEWCRLEARALGLAEALVGPDDEGNPS